MRQLLFVYLPTDNTPAGWGNVKFRIRTAIEAFCIPVSMLMAILSIFFLRKMMEMINPEMYPIHGRPSEASTICRNHPCSFRSLAYYFFHW